MQMSEEQPKRSILSRIKKSSKQRKLLGGLGAAVVVGGATFGGYKLHGYYNWHLRYYRYKDDNGTIFCIVCNRSIKKSHVVAIYQRGVPILNKQTFDLVRKDFPNESRDLERVDNKTNDEETKVLDEIRKNGSWAAAKALAVDKGIRPSNSKRHSVANSDETKHKYTREKSQMSEHNESEWLLTYLDYIVHGEKQYLVCILYRENEGVRNFHVVDVFDVDTKRVERTPGLISTLSQQYNLFLNEENDDFVVAVTTKKAGLLHGNPIRQQHIKILKASKTSSNIEKLIEDVRR